MCIIVYKPQGISVNKETLETCFTNNPDGAGFMYPYEGRLVIQKGYFEVGDLLTAWDVCHRARGDFPVVFHFRIATAGDIDIRNCHPHRIASDLGFVHNGILSCVTVPKDSPSSNTILYKNRYLARLTGKSLQKTGLFQSIGRHIGGGNKFVFMDGAGNVTICNEEQGLWKDGLWFSNTSFLPRWRFTIEEEFGWFCDYCGGLLETAEELAEGACHECLAYFESEYAECGGCFEPLVSNTHRMLGWCDDCGYSIYGSKWLEMLHETAATKSGFEIPCCF